MTDEQLRERVRRLEHHLGLEQDVSRRTALASLVGAGSAAFLAGRASAVEVEDAPYVGDFAHFTGPRDERPTPVGNNRYMYWATDSQEVFFTTWSEDSWTRFGEFSVTDDGTDTRANVSHDGQLVQADVVDIDFADGLDAIDDGDDTVTVKLDSDADDLRTDVSDDGTQVQADVKDINFGAGIDASDDGDMSVTVTLSDPRTDISAEGTEVQADATDVDFGPEFTVSSDGDDSVSVVVADPRADVSDDGSLVQEDVTDLNFVTGLEAVDDGDDSVSVNLLGLRRPSGALSVSLATDTWRTPNQDRPTLVSSTVELNPGSVSGAQLDLEVDEDGGTSSDYALSSSVPGSLSAAQLRSISAVLVPAGGSYQFNTVEAGDGVSVDTLVEHTL